MYAFFIMYSSVFPNLSKNKFNLDKLKRKTHIFYIKLQWMRASFGSWPKIRTSWSDMVTREIEQKLCDCVWKQILKENSL